MDKHDKQYLLQSAKKVGYFIVAGTALTIASVAATIGCLAGALVWISTHIDNTREGKEEGKSMTDYISIAPISIIKSVGGIGQGSRMESAGEEQALACGGRKPDKDSATNAVADQGTSGEDCALDTASEEPHHQPTVDPLKEVQELIDSDVREPSSDKSS